MHLTLLHPVPLSLDWLGPNFEVFYADSLWALVCIISNAPMLSTFKQYQMKISAKRSDLLMATIMASGMSFFMTLFATLLREGLTPRLSDAMGKLLRHQTWHKLPSGPSAVTNRKKDHRQNNYAGKDAFNGRHPLKSYQNDSNLARHDLIMHRSLSDLLDCNSSDVHDQEFVWL